MNAIPRSLQFLMAGILLAGQGGCSSSRMAVQSSSPNPQNSSVSVPGTADVAQGNEMRHPATVHVALARWQEKQKQLPQARESYQQALKHDPRSVEALLGLSRLDRLAGRMSEAEILLQKAEKMRPNDPLIAATWGEQYAAQGRWPEAIARYRSAVERAPEEAIYKHQLGVALVKSGATHEALLVFGEIVAPEEAHYNVGYLLQQQGKLMEAETEYQRALALNPTLTQASEMLTKVRAERGVSIAAKPDVNAPRPGGPAGAAPETTAGAVQPVVWQASGAAQGSPAGSPPATQGTITPATVTGQQQPPAGLSPQQLEQWRNQQVIMGRP